MNHIAHCRTKSDVGTLGDLSAVFERAAPPGAPLAYPVDDYNPEASGERRHKPVRAVAALLITSEN